MYDEFGMNASLVFDGVQAELVPMPVALGHAVRSDGAIALHDADLELVESEPRRVRVRGSDRIVRGLFSFYRGTVLAADVAENQARTPDVEQLIERTPSLFMLANGLEER